MAYVGLRNGAVEVLNRAALRHFSGAFDSATLEKDLRMVGDLVKINAKCTFKFFWTRLAFAHYLKDFPTQGIVKGMDKVLAQEPVYFLPRRHGAQRNSYGHIDFNVKAKLLAPGATVGHLRFTESSSLDQILKRDPWAV